MFKMLAERKRGRITRPELSGNRATPFSVSVCWPLGRVALCLIQTIADSTETFLAHVVIQQFNGRVHNIAKTNQSYEPETASKGGDLAAWPSAANPAGSLCHYLENNTFIIIGLLGERVCTDHNADRTWGVF